MPDVYDVALSLRWTDVEHARALYELLRDRLDVFFADERQPEFVGTDGEESFGHVFRDRARVVVVFYRADWGTTPFTRAEEAAIPTPRTRTRRGTPAAWPMDDDKAVPPYLPPQHIWFDFGQYGVSGLAAVVEERVRRAGLVVRPPSPADELRRMRRKREAKQRREEFVRSKEGTAFFNEQVALIEPALAGHVEMIAEADPDLRFAYEPALTGRGYHVNGGRYYGEITYSFRYGNVIEGSTLTWSVSRRRESGGDYNEAREVEKATYVVDLDDSDRPAWRSESGEYLPIERIVEAFLSRLAVLQAQAMTGEEPTRWAVF